MPHAPYHGSDLSKTDIWNIQAYAGSFYIMALNYCLNNPSESIMKMHLDMWNITCSFSVERFWFCLSGLKEIFYHNIYGRDIEDSTDIFEHFSQLTEDAIEKSGYSANVFMVFQNGIKQLAIILSPGPHPKCTPVELAEQINTLGQKVYEEELFHGDTRYCNVTALSDELHGYAGIREGYLQTRKLNDLSFFHMEPAVITTEWVSRRRNGADYRIVIGECRRLQQALDAGDFPACQRALDSLFLKTVKKAYSWTLLQDALSFCKHMLELRCTVRGLEAVDLAALCTPERYLRIEECVEALRPVLARLCELTKEQGPYQELMLHAIYYIKLHFTEDLALTDIAQYANVNFSYLSKAFQKEMGISVREFITAQRMEAAKALLRQSGLRISDVAEAVGIHDVKYFSRLFKKAEGMTAGEYRTSAKKT